MKALLVYPRFEKFLEAIPDLDRDLVDHFLGNFTMPPSLGIPILAALTPPVWEVEIVDDNAGDPVDFGARADLVAITCFTPQASRAAELSDGYRAAGNLVAMGGIFPSAAPEEALAHADAVSLGDGEATWARILEDAARGRLERVYDGGTRLDPSAVPSPRRDLLRGRAGYDWNEELVQVARGCDRECAMCAIPTCAGHRLRLRDPADVGREVATLAGRNVYLADDALFLPGRGVRRWASEILEALAPLGKRLFVSSTPGLDTSDEKLDLLARAGCASFYCTMNVEPLSIRALSGDPEARAAVVDLVARVEDRGMRFFASFAIGRDWDGPGTVGSILDLCDASGIRTAEFFLFTPYPGSPHFRRLERQGRILHRRWGEYNGAHVVFEPHGATPEQLFGWFADLWRQFYRDRAGPEVVEPLAPDRSPSHMRERRQRAGSAGSRR